MTLRLSGLHHVSSLSAHIGQTRDFFTRVLGMRPVITTVNQDAPNMYHLFFSDGAGSPGSDMTVFGLPHATPETHGNNSISLTTFRVHGRPALEYWAARLLELRVPSGDIVTRDGRLVLGFTDPLGTQLSFVDDGGAGHAVPWTESPVPAEHQIRGLGYVVITVPELDPTHRFLTHALGLRLDHSYPLDEMPHAPNALDSPEAVHVYVVGDGGAHAEVHVAVRSDLPRAKYGSGGVHHVALRVPAGQSMTAWSDHLETFGYHSSGIVDRHYFTSIYVREPNHVLFELATDGPGFDVDGPVDPNRLSLPPFLEPRRAEIEAGLEPL